MNKFKEIRNLYRIEEIKDDYVLLQINKKLEKLYIYEVHPMLFLDLSEDIQESVINIFNQLLRECDFNLQFIISNRKLDIQKYIRKYLQLKENVPIYTYNLYVQDMKEKLKQEDIYETEMLIAYTENAKEDTSIKKVDKLLLKLEEIGCKVKKIDGKINYEDLLHKYLNKT